MVHSFKFISVSRKKYCKVTSGCLHRTIFNLSSRSLRFRSPNKEESAKEEQQKYKTTGWRFKFHPTQKYTDYFLLGSQSSFPLITKHLLQGHRKSGDLQQRKHGGFFPPHSWQSFKNWLRMQSLLNILAFMQSTALLATNQRIQQVKYVSTAQYRDHISLWTSEFGSLPKLFSDVSNRTRLDYVCFPHTSVPV